MESMAQRDLDSSMQYDAQAPNAGRSRVPAGLAARLFSAVGEGQGLTAGSGEIVEKTVALQCQQHLHNQQPCSG